ncbi:MAG: hypothetical protein Q4C78_02310 [Synergistaceae bacterium]|nr:hypothetical protein [Synergistaceae bacterium]
MNFLNFFFFPAILLSAVFAFSFLVEKVRERLQIYYYATHKKLLLPSSNYIRFLNVSSLPNGANAKACFSLSILSFASLFIVTSALPFSSFVPLSVNRGDLLQIVYFLLFSELLLLSTFLALRSEQAISLALDELAKFFRFIAVYVAFLFFFASYLTTNSVELDPFNANLLLIFPTITDMSFRGVISILLFIVLIILAIPTNHETRSYSIISDVEMPEFAGVSRLLVHFISIFRSVLFVFMLCYSLVPYESLYGRFAVFDTTLMGQFIFYICFMLFVFVMAVIIVPLVKLAYSKCMQHFPKRFEIYTFIFLTFIAVVLMALEEDLLVQEAASF